MPLYEYKCDKCGQISTFIEKVGKTSFWNKVFKKKCQHCKRRALTKILSSFSTHRNLSYTDTLNDISKIAPINFVPGSPTPQGPPAGGCPYANTTKEKASPKQTGPIEIR